MMNNFKIKSKSGMFIYATTTESGYGRLSHSLVLPLSKGIKTKISIQIWRVKTTSSTLIQDIFGLYRPNHS